MNPAFFLACSFCVAAVDNTPLAVKAPDVDRGEVKAGTPLVQSFELTNHSTSPLVIENIASSCGCTQPRLSKRELDPGSTTRLEVAVNTLSQPAGMHSWKSTVHFKSGETTGSIELQIRARIVREISIEPVALALTLDKGATHTITIADRRAKPLTATEVHTTSAELKARLGVRTASTDGGSRQQVYVTITDDYPPGRRTETLQLLTDDAEYRELRVPITIDRRAADRVAASPDRIDLRLAKGQSTANGLVQLRDVGGKAVVVDRIEVDNPAIRTRWAAGPGPMATLRLGVELSSDASAGDGVVTVYLKEPHVHVVTIPVRWQR